MGATPRWMGYVGVNDVDATADRLKRLGGAVYVPPTDSNIGRISVVADPQTATLALVKGLKTGPTAARRSSANRGAWAGTSCSPPTGRRRLLSTASFLAGRRADAEIGPTDTYQLFSAGGQTIGGMFTKRPTDPVPYWLYYFNVDDIDAAVERVKTAGGRIFEGPLELPGGSWIARCRDPQGAAFALQGKRSRDAVGWSTEWGGFSSKGRLVTSLRGSAGPAPDISDRQDQAGSCQAALAAARPPVWAACPAVSTRRCSRRRWS